MTTIGTKVYTKFHGEFVGEDEFGNRYYRGTAERGECIGRYDKERRWVDFNGKPEPSKVPAIWFGWLHYTTDEFPVNDDLAQDWQKKHLPNLTGTAYAYHPLGENSEAIKGYQAWQPE